MLSREEKLIEEYENILSKDDFSIGEQELNKLLKGYKEKTKKTIDTMFDGMHH